MITLNTILYEGNFDKFLSKDSWFFNFNSKYITKKMLTINNITSTEKFINKVNDLKELFDFHIVYVEDYKDIVNKKYDLNIDKSTIGYYYTIPYFVAIENVNTQFLLNIASDCMEDINISDDFFKNGIKEINTNPLCSSVMVSWVKNNKIMVNGLTVGQHEENETANHTGSKKFNYTKGFTDQFFLASVEKLKKINYNIDISFSNTYNGPSYGGNCFEKRIVGYQNYNKIYNCISKSSEYYIHNNNNNNNNN
jgi:hypothetical protein